MPTTLRIMKPTPTFKVDEFLRSGGVGTRVAVYQPGGTVFSQGDASDSVMYLQEGTVKLSVLSVSGQQAVIAIAEPDAFLGERSLAGRPVRHETVTAMTTATVLIIPKEQMLRLLREQPAFSWERRGPA